MSILRLAKQQPVCNERTGKRRRLRNVRQEQIVRALFSPLECRSDIYDDIYRRVVRRVAQASPARKLDDAIEVVDEFLLWAESLKQSLVELRARHPKD